MQRATDRSARRGARRTLFVVTKLHSGTADPFAHPSMQCLYAFCPLITCEYMHCSTEPHVPVIYLKPWQCLYRRGKMVLAPICRMLMHASVQCASLSLPSQCARMALPSHSHPCQKTQLMVWRCMHLATSTQILCCSRGYMLHWKCLYNREPFFIFSKTF